MCSSTRFITFALLLLSTTAWSQDLKSCHTGSWSDPAYRHEGLSLDVDEDYYVAYFMSHHPNPYDGRSVNQIWYVVVGDPQTGQGEVFDTQAEVVNGKIEVYEYRVGDAELQPDPEIDGMLNFSWHLRVNLDGPLKEHVLCTVDCDGVRLLRQFTRPTCAQG